MHKYIKIECIIGDIYKYQKKDCLADKYTAGQSFLG